MSKQSTEFGPSQFLLAVVFVISSGYAIWDATLSWTDMYAGGIRQIFFFLMLAVALSCLGSLIAWFVRRKRALDAPTDTEAQLAESKLGEQPQSPEEAHTEAQTIEQNSEQWEPSEVSYDRRSNPEKIAGAIALTIVCFVVGIFGVVATAFFSGVLPMWVAATSVTGIVVSWYMPFRKFSRYETREDFNAAIKPQIRSLFVWVGIYAATLYLAILGLGQDLWVVCVLALSIVGSCLVASAHKANVLKVLQTEGSDLLIGN